MTNKQIMAMIRRVYNGRKAENRLYSMRELSAEIGIGRSTLYSAIKDKVASAETLAKLSDYLKIGR